MGHHQFYIWIVGSGCCHTYDDQEAALGHEDLPINMVFLVIMLFVTEYDYKGIEQTSVIKQHASLNFSMLV